MTDKLREIGRMAIMKKGTQEERQMSSKYAEGQGKARAAYMAATQDKNKGTTTTITGRTQTKKTEKSKAHNYKGITQTREQLKQFITSSAKSTTPKTLPASKTTKTTTRTAKTATPSKSPKSGPAKSTPKATRAIKAKSAKSKKK
jgi:hypothetical protein